MVMTSLPAITQRSCFAVYRERIKLARVGRKANEKGYRKDSNSNSAQPTAFRKLGVRETVSRI